jgi:hypothetical protein
MWGLFLISLPFFFPCKVAEPIHYIRLMEGSTKIIYHHYWLLLVFFFFFFFFLANAYCHRSWE